jgi:GNAT superfamily N-acetyltransferase
MNHQIIELKGKETMLNYLEIIQELYPEMDRSLYETYLDQMLGSNYGQILVTINDKPAAISGYWRSVKLWCGRYLELDNVIVSEEFRGKGIGKLIQNYLEEKARNEQCNIMVLDAYTRNFKAHKFYYNEGYVPKGFHFIKDL